MAPLEMSWNQSLAALVLAAFGASCRVPDLYVQNLQNLHDPEGRTRFYAEIDTSMAYGFQQVIGRDFDNDEPEVLEDPYGQTLENLLELASFDSSDPRTAGMQVEMFSWLAVEDRYVLARERCVLELAQHAQLLGLQRALELPEEADPSGPEVVATALEGLQDEAYAVLRGSPEGDPFSLSQACERVRDLVVDRAGGRRLLGFCNIALSLHSGRGVSAEVRAASQPFYDLHRDLQRELVSQALAESLQDEQALVRAAALRAVYALPETDRGALLLQALEDRDRDVGVAGLLAAAEHGLPEGPPPSAFGAKDWPEVLVGLAQVFDGRISAAACRALGRATGDAQVTLRPEEWSARHAQRSEGALLP